jgi:hypothetical protein
MNLGADVLAVFTMHAMRGIGLLAVLRGSRIRSVPDRTAAPSAA